MTAMTERPNNDPWDDPRLTAHVLDQLSDSDAEAMRRRTEEDPHFAAAVDEMAALRDAVKEHYATEVIPDRTTAVPQPSGAPKSHRGWFAVALAVAAGLIAMGTITPNLFERRTPTLARTDDLVARSWKASEDGDGPPPALSPRENLHFAKESRTQDQSPFGSGQPAVGVAAASKKEADPRAAAMPPYPPSTIAPDGDVYGSARAFRMESYRTANGQLRQRAVPFTENNFGFGVDRETAAANETIKVQLRVPVDREWSDLADRDRFDPIEAPGFRRVADDPLSTFSIDVDTASFTKVRSLIRRGVIPRPDMVRTEEFINYFRYDPPPLSSDHPHPIGIDAEVTACPWNADHRLARVGVFAPRIDPADRPRCNLVFLVDVSGSMSGDDKLPLVVDGLRQLTGGLRDDDSIAIVTYAGGAELALPATRGDRRETILAALNSLRSGGSTAGAAGIETAYDIAVANRIDDGVNRVLLCTDGDFNVGASSDDALDRKSVV